MIFIGTIAAIALIGLFAQWVKRHSTFVVYYKSGKWGSYRVCECKRFGTEFGLLDNICEVCGADMPKQFCNARARFSLFGKDKSFRWETR